jgi:hypothetical protein
MSDRPQEIRPPHVFCNFKKPKDGRKRKNSQRSRKRPGMSADHLSLIRQMPCCITLVMPGGEAHHVKSNTGERGMGLRSTDKWAVPMAHEPHMEVERVGSRKERIWFRERGIDVHALAAALWANTGDLPRMIAVLMVHVRGGR